MIEANRFVFPCPKYSTNNAHYYTHIKNHLLHFPKRTQSNGCFSQTQYHSSTYHFKNISNLSTARSNHPQQTPRTCIKIQSSRQLKLKIQPNHFTKHSADSDSQNMHIQTHFPTRQGMKMLGTAKYFDNTKQEQFEYHDFRKHAKIEQLKQVLCQRQRQSSPCQTLLKFRLEEQFEPHGDNFIPCLYYSSSNEHKIMVYFHGNGEDIIGCSSFVRSLSEQTGISVLIVEYPGYSIYQGHPSSQKIESDALEIIQNLTQVGFQHHNIVILGRSIGSGPALHASSHFSLGGLILLSPFLSLCEVVKDLYGRVASGLLVQRFDNKERARYVNSPVLIVHGTKDTLIPEKHAVELCKYFRGFTTLKIVKNMSHSVFSHEQFFGFVQEFCGSIGFN